MVHDHGITSSNSELNIELKRVEGPLFFRSFIYKFQLFNRKYQRKHIQLEITVKIMTKAIAKAAKNSAGILQGRAKPSQIGWNTDIEGKRKQCRKLFNVMKANDVEIAKALFGKSAKNSFEKS